MWLAYPSHRISSLKDYIRKQEKWLKVMSKVQNTPHNTWLFSPSVVILSVACHYCKYGRTALQSPCISVSVVLLRFPFSSFSLGLTHTSIKSINVCVNRHIRHVNNIYVGDILVNSSCQVTISSIAKNPHYIYISIHIHKYVYMCVFGNCSFKVPEMRQTGFSLGNEVGCV